MKSITLALAAAILSTAALGMDDARAQVEFTLGGGLNNPTGDYGKEANAGYAVSTGLGYRFLPYVMAGAEANLFGNGASDDYLASLGDGWDLNTTTFHYAGVVRALLPVLRHHVFAKGTFGNYRVAATANGPSGELSGHVTETGYGLGAGLLINGREGSSFFLDVTYHKINADEMPGGARMVTVNAGMQFAFDLRR